MAVTKQYFNGEEIDRNVRSQLVTVSEDCTPTLTLLYTAVNSYKQTYSEEVSSSVTFKFVDKMYWGASENDTLTNEDVLGLEGVLTESVVEKLTINCEGGKYMYIVIPEDIIPEGMNIYYGNMLFTNWEITDMQVTNQHGYTNNCKVFRSLNKQTFDEIELTLQ